MKAPEPRVWLVDDDASIRWVLERALRGAGMLTQAFTAADPALAALGSDAPDVLITDVRMAGQSGIELLRRVRANHPGLPVIVMTAHSDLDTALAAYAGGAFEYLPKPFDIDHAVDLVRRAAAGRVREQDESAASATGRELLGRAAAMQEVFRAIGRLARSSVNVLITGEPGTGKELVARALHEHSPRAGKPFIALNAASLPPELLESELFGHEAGALAANAAQRRGRLEQAQGGTLFLDEVGDLPTALQGRMWRVLAEGEFHRVGGQAPVRVDVRVIAATRHDLEARVRSGQFREDLLGRLEAVRIELPPLRARREDVPDLLQHYLKVAARELGTAPRTMAAAVVERLAGYRWPGNVRELANLCRRLTALAPGAEIGLADLPTAVSGRDIPPGAAPWLDALADWADRQLRASPAPLLETALPEFERTLLRAALRATHGRRQEAARLLGWGRNTLTRKLRELGVADPDSDGDDAPAHGQPSAAGGMTH